MNIKTVLKYILYGIQWGCTFFVLTNIIVLLIVGEQTLLTADTFVKSAILAMFVGIGTAGTSIVYTFDNWTFIKQVSVHFIVGLSTYFLAAYIGGWFEFSFDFVFVVAIIASIIVFWVIWFAFYLVNKNDEKNINSRLKEIQKEDNSDD